MAPRKNAGGGFGRCLHHGKIRGKDGSVQQYTHSPILFSPKQSMRSERGNLALPVSAALFLFGLASFSVARFVEQGATRNMVLVIADDLAARMLDELDTKSEPGILSKRYRGFGLKGFSYGETVMPGAASISREPNSYVFTNAFSNGCVCAPSRMALFTGSYPRTVGVHDNRLSLSKLKEEAIHFVTEDLRSGGVKTLGFGKTLHGKFQRRYADRLWDKLVKRVPKEQRPRLKKNLCAEMQNAVRSQPQFFVCGKYLKEDVAEGSTRVNSDDSYVSAFKDFLLSPESRTGPWFAVVGFDAPHAPFVSEKRFWKKTKAAAKNVFSRFEDEVGFSGVSEPFARAFDLNGTFFNAFQRNPFVFQRAYIAYSARLDQKLYEVWTALKESAFSNNTLFVFTSDNGFHIGEKAVVGKGTLYQQSVRVPMLLSVPDSFFLQRESAESNSAPASVFDKRPATSTSDRPRKNTSVQLIRTPVSHVDVVPTIRAWFGVKPASTDAERYSARSAKSLLDIITNQHPSERHVFVQCLAPSAQSELSDAVYSGNHALLKCPEKPFSQILPPSGEFAVEAYDLCSDQEQNLAIVNNSLLTEKLETLLSYEFATQ